MTNNTQYYFKDLESMFGKKPAYILVTSKLESQEISGRKVITMSVELSGFDESNQIIFRAPGCPCPPCKPAHAVDTR
jgi:hypothetical protein